MAITDTALTAKEVDAYNTAAMEIYKLVETMKLQSRDFARFSDEDIDAVAYFCRTIGGMMSYFTPYDKDDAANIPLELTSRVRALTNAAVVLTEGWTRISEAIDAGNPGWPVVDDFMFNLENSPVNPVIASQLNMQVLTMHSLSIGYTR